MRVQIWRKGSQAFDLHDSLRYRVENQFVLRKETSGHRMTSKDSDGGSEARLPFPLAFLLTTAGGDSTGQTPLDPKERT